MQHQMLPVTENLCICPFCICFWLHGRLQKQCGEGQPLISCSQASETALAHGSHDTLMQAISTLLAGPRISTDWQIPRCQGRSCCWTFSTSGLIGSGSETSCRAGMQGSSKHGDIWVQHCSVGFIQGSQRSRPPCKLRKLILDLQGVLRCMLLSKVLQAKVVLFSRATP